MALLRRREKPPTAVLAVLQGDERVLSWADTSDGESVVATQYGLWWPEQHGEHRLIRWEHVDKAIWRDGVLVVTEGEVVDDLLLVDRDAVSVALVVPRDLPPTVRARVEGNIVSRELVSVPGGAVRFVARRLPGRDGLTWWAHLEPGTRDTAGMRAAIAARVETLRVQALRDEQD